MATHQHATIDDLYREEGKAELVGGEIVRMSPAGRKRGKATFNLCLSLGTYLKSAGLPGDGFADGTGFLCDLPHRQSFCPDAAYYTGPHFENKFLPQAPDFAVEIRSEEDYGPKAEQRLADKRADYFAAGAKVVGTWNSKAKTWYAFIELPIRRCPRSTVAANSPKRSPPYPDGRCRSTNFSTS